MRLLFVCARNRLRSPTAERVFAAVPGVEAESAGVAPGADTPVTPELLEWADVILVMEPAHRARLAKLLPHALRGKRVACLDISDDYAYMDAELVRLLWDRVSRVLPAPAIHKPARAPDAFSQNGAGSALDGSSSRCEDEPPTPEF